MSGITAYGLREARRLIHETRKLMTGNKTDYARGFRASLEQVELLITVRLNDIAAKERSALTPGDKTP